MYRLTNLSKYYNSDNKVNKALDNISLEIKQNEFVMISGPSGSGKSTLLNVLSGIDNYQEGEMYFNNKETSYYDENDYEKFRYENISFVFQEYNLIESYTCKQNIEIALISKNISYDDEYIKQILNKVNLLDKMGVKAAKLSGGQKARLAIARALAFNSPILVLDEPTGALDSKSSAEIVNLLQELKGYKTIIVVTHNEELFANIANHHIKIKDGKIKEDKYVSETINKKIKESNNTKKYNKESFIAKLNIKNQPKKSILSFSLSFVLTLFIILIISNLSYMGKQDNAQQNLSNSYDRIVIQKDDGFNEDDLNYFNKHSYQIIEENSLLDVMVSVKELQHQNTYYQGLLDIKNLKDDELIIGNKPTNDLEVVMPYNKKIFDSWNYYQNKKVSFHLEFNEINASFSFSAKVVGMAKNNYYYLNNGKDISIIFDAIRSNKTSLTTIDDPVKVIFDSNINDNKIHTNKDYKLLINNQEINTIKDLNDSFEVIYQFNPSYFKSLINTNNEVISVYTHDVKKLANSLDDKYDFYIPNVKLDNIDFTRMIITFLSVIMAALIYLLVFLTNVITKQIYRYKNKDNAILNSLGYSTKTLKNSLALELVINYTISLIIMLIVIILDKSFNLFKGFFSYNSIYSYIIIFIILGLTIYSGIKNVFNMFSKNSLFKNLRGGDNNA